jgi:hypothetical protein
MSNLAPLAQYPALVLRQRKELAELLGYESRNKYEVLDPHGTVLLYAAEQGKGLGAMFARQLFGHWRSLRDSRLRQHAQRAPARGAPLSLVLSSASRSFDGRGAFSGRAAAALGVLLEALRRRRRLGAGAHPRSSSPLWRPWTFRFERAGQRVASVVKKWSGALTELFTDADSFRIEYEQPGLSPDERALLLCAGVFIDMQYFEAKANSSSSITVSAD